MSQVSLRQVSKFYPAEKGRAQTEALRDFSLEVAERELLVLAGPSGSGKSTILRLIACLEAPSSGEISIGGRAMKEVLPREREVALVFKNYALYPHLSVAGNLAFALTARSYPKAEIQKRVGQAAVLLGIEELLERKPAELSAVQSLRVALGRAIVRQPKVFLFDEPLAGLDAALRAPLRMEIGRLHERLQTTMLYVTSDPTEAMTLGQRVGVLDRGAVQQIDTPLKLYREPANRFVAGFVGSPPMNFVRGKLFAVESGDGSNGGFVFKESDGVLLGHFPAASAAAAYQKFVGQEVVLGVRPEDITPLPPSATAPPAKGKSAADGSFQAVVDQVEILGAETIFYLQTSDSGSGPALVCRGSLAAVDEAETSSGRRRRFQINGSKAHLFDPATAQRIA